MARSQLLLCFRIASPLESAEGHSKLPARKFHYSAITATRHTRLQRNSSRQKLFRDALSTTEHGLVRSGRPLNTRRAAKDSGPGYSVSIGRTPPPSPMRRSPFRALARIFPTVSSRFDCRSSPTNVWRNTPTGPYLAPCGAPLFGNVIRRPFTTAARVSPRDSPGRSLAE